MRKGVIIAIYLSFLDLIPPLNKMLSKIEDDRTTKGHVNLATDVTSHTFCELHCTYIMPRHTGGIGDANTVVDIVWNVLQKGI